MSHEDRDRWNARYAEGAYANRDHPSPCLTEHIDQLPRGEALDLACGAGRNSRYLAQLGWHVTAVDISDEGLARVIPEGLAGRIVTEQADLEGDYQPNRAFDLIVIIRYLNLDLVRAASTWLTPGGMLLCEVLLAGAPVQSAGPPEHRFRAQPGQLRNAASSLELLHSFEGDVRDPDGRTARVARLLAVRH